uniref:F-box associated domain-containing protein n=1 Tax=Aegilops tauschii TaxID=37682 RepID=M8BN29_AEGTA
MSETGAWGELTSTHGSSLLYFVIYEDYQESGWILEYDLSRHSLTLFSAPDNNRGLHYLVLTEDGGLGVIQQLHPHLKLWTREANNGTDARWVLSRVISPCNLLPTSARLGEGYRVLVVGFAEGANAIFVCTMAGLFTIELQSEQVRKLCDDCSFRNVVPVVTFYTPVPRGNHQNLLLWSLARRQVVRRV